MFARAQLAPNVRYTTTNYELARCLVGRGLGYSVQVQRLSTSITYDGHEVVSLEIADEIASSTVGLARPNGAPTSAKYSALRAMLSVDTA